MKNKKKRKYLNKKLRLNLLFILFLFYATSGHAQTSYFETSTPEAQGMSSLNILKFIDRLEAEIDAVHSFMIIRHGKLVSQGWWDPYQSDVPHMMNSVSKSFISTAIGFAIQENIISLDDLAISFFPNKVNDNHSWHWNEMRVKDLLAMNTGHLKQPVPVAMYSGKVDWNPDIQNELGNIDWNTDWVKYFFDSKVDFMPGTHWMYNTMASNVLAAIIKKATGQDVVDYLDSRFFKPLGIDKPEWDRFSGGNTGWGICAKTEDIAKLGQFYLQKGKWNGIQLLNADWIDLATSKQSSNGSNPDNDFTQGYGYQFWLSRHNSYRADGLFSQFSLILPDQDLVIAITSGSNDMVGVMNIAWETLLLELSESSLPASKKNYNLLKKKTKGLALRPVVGELSNVRENISGRLFEFEIDELNRYSMKLDLNSKNHEIELFNGENNQIIKVGFNMYEKSDMIFRLPHTERKAYLQGEEYKIAASGAWSQPNEYKLRIYFYSSTASMDYTFIFEEDKLIWKTDFRHLLDLSNGDSKTIEIEF